MMFNQSQIITDISNSKKHVESMGLRASANIDLLCIALHETKDLVGCYVECGVFRGSTLFAAAEFARLREIKRKFYGIDTFSGFDPSSVTDNDKPYKFQVLRDRFQISEEHYEKAAARTMNFRDDSHLQQSYFFDVGSVFERAANEGVTLLVGKFIDVIPTLDEPIVVLHLDCDLYSSYRDCLEMAYDKVVRGGFVVLDEYYSLKYPGARIAVDEFMESVSGAQLIKHVTSDFERWCIVKS
jgi:hypothetical protein